MLGRCCNRRLLASLPVKASTTIRNHVKKTFDVPTLLRFKTTMSASSVEMLQGRELEIPVPWGKITGRINC